ncbi:prepilin-type N-terminal cleavage/methylation domain-containing protein [Aestuariivita sp.]|jgi:general secretion pathway protein I|uniref:prepilin-type N-terminal cleavage/methylation domain-containing protein n=1 Tax=Aestuariivita sp. TaxID=1872407 RepID=UPI00216D7DDF|nr:prepilin-type N-terminal cleavage/methylation domain-containing protein [Aestuariivita sp.]MCE8009875.1 prepilin-type N-terminal cleavage/methylation domain-containing protein [Aestuariivita sp.]
MQRGLTLLELVVAIAILAIGSMAALRAADQSRLGLGEAPQRLLAQVAAKNRAEELRLLGVGAALPDQVVIGPYRFGLDTRTQATAGGLIRAEIVARSDQGPGALMVVYLPPGMGP